MKIHLDSPNRGYLPGALVRGEIELDPSSDGEQGTLSIVFSGRSMIELKAWSVGPGDYGRNTQFLISSKLSLYEGNSGYMDMPAGGHPFLFTFPSKMHNALGQRIWSDSAKYGSPKDWSHSSSLNLLPRSLSYTGGPILSATVEYRLDARWSSDTRQERKSVTLPFDTYRSEPTPHVTSLAATDSFSFRSTFLPNEQAHDCPLTVTDRFHMAFGSEGISTKMKFQIETKIGTKIVQGEVPLVELRLSYVTRKSTSAEIPAVRLRFLTIHLERITAVRTPRRASSHLNTVFLGTNCSLDLVLPEGTVVNISEALGLRTEDIPYDIHTFNFRQTHKMRLYFTVECMEKRFEFQKEADLTILSPFYEESPPCFREIQG